MLLWTTVILMSYPKFHDIHKCVIVIW